MNADQAAHERRCADAAAAMRAAAQAGPPRLDKRTSNLFRDRRRGAAQRLDLGAFDNVLAVDRDAGWVEAEGGARYEQLVQATLPLGVMPAVVPQLKTITAGGAVAGVGIEATSFRHGLVHHTLRELEVLLPDGEVVRCTADNEHADLFHAFPNSYGTLGYALRVKLQTLPVKPWVSVEHRRHARPRRFFADLAAACTDERADFVDGVVFDGRTQVLSVGRFVDEAPWASDYGYLRIYYRSLLQQQADYLSTAHYLWRWDTDWFWCSRNFGAQHRWVRRLLGRGRLNSRTYTRLMRWNSRWGFSRAWARLRGDHPESVIQDVDIPIEQADAFLQFLLERIGILPVWICPLRAPRHAAGQGGGFTLYPLRHDALYVNFGFWDVVHARTPHEPGHFNRLIEREVVRLGGIKSLYSDSFFEPAEFARLYGAEAYERVKQRYDPQHRLLGLYDKCVLRR